jgi:hypothetical protein
MFDVFGQLTIPDFKPVDSDLFKREPGTNAFSILPQEDEAVQQGALPILIVCD